MRISSRRTMFFVTTLSVATTAAWATEYGAVISSTPIVVAVPVPQRECSDQPVEVRQSGSGAGALFGGLVGAAIGNSFGAGMGRAAATGLGLVAGAAIGDQAEANSRPPVASTATRCRTVSQYENRTTGYDVVYEYQGVRRRTQVAQDPGDRIALDINVAPVGAAPPPRPVYTPRAPAEYAPESPRSYYAPPVYETPYYTAPVYPAQYYPAPYYQAPYYQAPYYPAPYYANPWPVVSLGIVYAGGWRGHGRRH